MKHLRIYEEFENENELNNSIREYLIAEFPSDWWNEEFSNRVYDYVDEDEWIGENGDPDDELTWEYSGPEEAYQNFCNGGAIEYDLIEEIAKEIKQEFHLNDDDFDKNKIYTIIEDHMCNMIDWYDNLIFGKSSENTFDTHESNDSPEMELGSVEDTRSFQDKLDDLEKSRDKDGYVTLKDGSKFKI